MHSIGILRTSAVVFCVAAPLVAATAQPVILSSGNSTAQVSPNDSQGMISWSVDGVNQLNQQSFWYRIGPVGGEAALNTISVPSVTLEAPNLLTALYGNAQFSLRLDYQLVGGAIGSGSSSLSQNITIHNLSGSPLDLHFFQYADFNLAGSPSDSTLVLQRSDITGLWRSAYQADYGSLTETVETGNAPGATHGQTSLFPVILSELGDADPTTLNDIPTPLGTGDLTWAFQWDFTIPAAGSETLGLTKIMQVPEPGMSGFVVAGLIALVLLRRR